jgi:hypothetical protein
MSSHMASDEGEGGSQSPWKQTEGMDRDGLIRYSLKIFGYLLLYSN